MVDYALKYRAIRSYFNISQAEMARISGSSRSIISQIEIGKLKPSLENIANVSKALSIKLDYFFSEEYKIDSFIGDKNAHLIAHPNAHLIPNNDPDLLIKGQKRGSIILVPVKARAGYLSGYGDPEFIESLETFNIPGCHNGNYRMFEVEGYSMYPTFAPGDYVVGERILGPGEIRADTIYIIVSKREGIVIKRSINNSFNNSAISLRSDNLDRLSYPEINMPLSEVAEIWRFYMLLTKLTGESGRVVGHLQHLEGQVNQVLKLLRKK